MESAQYHPLALRTSLTPGRETPIRFFDFEIWNAVRLQKALYAETRPYKDVRIHVFLSRNTECQGKFMTFITHSASSVCATNAQHRTDQPQD